MCRFVTYVGKKPVLISDLLEKPNNSLIKQSRPSEDGLRRINADGVGVAWYDFSLGSSPGVYRSIQPAWNDKNLDHITSRIKSKCFLGHIRASTVGDVSLHNCHPFSYDDYAFVHNGSIRKFAELKRDLLNELSHELFLTLNGSTDSEYLFTLMMHYVHNENLSLSQAVFKGFQWVIDKQKTQDKKHFAKLNIAITDGKSLIATRFSTKGHDCLSLYFSVLDDAVIISSEPLDNTAEGWSEVPENHYIEVNDSPMSPIIKPISLE